MSSLFIVIPAYNEAENIERTVSEWYPIVESHNKEGQSRLVIINDGSKDNTYELICKLAQARPLLIPLTKPNGGHGSTVLYGYRYAIEHRADYIFQTDSDGQTNPDEFEAFWKKRNTYDAIIGNRKVRGGCIFLPGLCASGGRGRWHPGLLLRRSGGGEGRLCFLRIFWIFRHRGLCGFR